MRNAAVVHLSYDEIKERLGISQYVNLVAVVQERIDVITQKVAFVIEHDELPECCEGCEPRGMTIEQVQETVNE